MKIILFNKKIAVFSIMIFVVILSINIISLFLNTAKIEDFVIFKDINECYSIEDYKIDSKINDKYIKDSDFEKSFVASVENEQCEFQIYAYKFKSQNEAKNYYRRYLNSNLEKIGDCGYDFSAGTATAKGIVFNGKNLYRISCASSELDDVNTYLSSKFTLIYSNSENKFERQSE